MLFFEVQCPYCIPKHFLCLFLGFVFVQGMIGTSCVSLEVVRCRTHGCFAVNTWDLPWTNDWINQVLKVIADFSFSSKLAAYLFIYN